MCGRMIVQVNGVAYYQFSSQESAREVLSTDPVVLHRVRDGALRPDQAFWTLVPPWTESATSVREARGTAQRSRPQSP